LGVLSELPDNIERTFGEKKKEGEGSARPRLPDPSFLSARRQTGRRRINVTLIPQGEERKKEKEGGGSYPNYPDNNERQKGPNPNAPKDATLREKEKKNTSATIVENATRALEERKVRSQRPTP